MERQKKEKEESRNRGTSENEEEQRNVTGKVCRKDKTKAEGKAVLFAQSNSQE